MSLANCLAKTPIENFRWLYEKMDKDFKDKDCNEQVRAFHAIRDCYQTNLERELVTEVAGFVSVAVFAKTHLPDYVRLPFGTHHKQFFEAIPRGERGKKVNILAPRGSSKSTSMAVFYPLHCIYYKDLYEALGMKSEKYILIVSRSLGNALDRIKDIKSEIDVQPTLQHLRGNETWGEMRSITSNGILLVPQSRGGKVRGSLFKGYRPSLVIPDDLDDMDSIRNPKTLQKDEEWFDSDLLECGDADTNFVCVDTVKGENAIANQLRSRPAWQTIFIQAIPEPDQLVHPTAEGLWKEYRRIYSDSTLEPQERAIQMDSYYAKHESEMNADVQETWSDKWTYRLLREKEFDQGRAAVLREYQNYPVDMEQAIFDMENASTFKVDIEGLLRSDDRLVRWGQISGATVFLDWAGVKESLDRCYACVVAMLWEPVYQAQFTAEQTPQAYGYVYRVWIDRGSREKQLTALYDVYNHVHDFLHLRVGRPEIKVYCEDFVDTTGDIRENFLRHAETVKMAKDLVGVNLQFLPRNRNKEDRIAALESPIGNGWLAFNEDLPKTFMDQMRQFPVSDFNDGPDACEGAWACKVESTFAEREARQERARQRVEDSRVLRL